MLVFSSSLAVYGSDDALPIPAVVDESTLPVPQTSYGAQKLACEHFIADATRKGYVDGRVVRLMTVVVRPGQQNAAASSFLSSIVRDRSRDCPGFVRWTRRCQSPFPRPHAVLQAITIWITHLSDTA